VVAILETTMSDSSNIEWTDATWSPVTGCTRVSPGCDHCYSVRMTHRLENMGRQKYAGLTVLNPAGSRHFNGVVRCHDDELQTPLRWKRPRRIFVCSMSDLFHARVPFDFIDKVFAVMALCPQHTFQVLTKRPERMAEYFSDTHKLALRLQEAIICTKGGDEKVHRAWHLGFPDWTGWPLPNVWLGTSVENQKAADERIPHLLRCPAAIRFLSIEPLLGPIDLLTPRSGMVIGGVPAIDWVIVGSESGPGRREMKTEWAESIAAQCHEAGAAFFMKQMVVGGKVSGEIGDFPESLRVRELPTVRAAAEVPA
jgi:protein gp37